MQRAGKTVAARAAGERLRAKRVIQMANLMVGRTGIIQVMFPEDKLMPAGLRGAKITHVRGLIRKLAGSLLNRLDSVASSYAERRDCSDSLLTWRL